MIVYYKNSEIDREQWDNCIRNSSGAKPYAFSWYLDIVSPGWEALVDDDYDSVFPVPYSSRFGIRHVTTPLLMQQLGAYSPDKPASRMALEFLDYMPEIFKIIDLCIGQKIEHAGYKVTEKSNVELKLSASYEKLLDRFSPECCKNIRAAAKKKFELTEKISPEELIELSIQARSPFLKGIKSSAYDKMRNLMHHCINNKTGRIIGVRSAGKRIVSALFLIEMKRLVTALIFANSPEEKQKSAGYFLINEIIKNHSLSTSLIDFAGLPAENDGLSGHSFGGETVTYCRIYRNRLLWPIM